MIPLPNEENAHGLSDWFSPSLDLATWAHDTFIAEGAELENPDHAHLKFARIGFLWTNVSNSKKGRMVIGTAEKGQPQGAMGKWSKARAELQVVDWFGQVPDFIITIHAEWWLQAGDAERCALVEHELYHCAQDKDAFGAPKFSKSTGMPVYMMRGHDVEEFIGVVRRYGGEATQVQELVNAANAEPEIALAEIAHACGNCG